MSAVRTVAIPGSSAAAIDLGASDIQSYRGYSLRATTTGIINIRQGGASGLILDTLALTAPGSDSKFYDPAINCDGDLYFEIVSGVWVGSLRYG